MREMPNNDSSIEGQAALSICESMLIALSDLKVVTQKAARDVLTDAASAHRGSGGNPGQVAKHEAIAVIIDRVRTSANSVPR